ncbi:MAG: hypothetical protein M1819_006937 [Sarea resinae]|nr:MAG: hypothetical protein M1819_006937 [Sarea resinae]
MAAQLVPMPEIEKLSAIVTRVLGGNPGKFTLQGTNTYLVGKGPWRLLIDTGEGKSSWINALTNVLQSERASLHGVILTHWHHDHVGGVSDVLKFFPDAKVYKHQPGVGQLDLRDGQKLAVEGATLRAFHCPGHTADHMALFLEEENAMFTGDNVLGHGTAVFEDLIAYLRSLNQMQHQFSGRAYPGHGAIIEAGNSKIVDYIEHRKQREYQVLEVLGNGETSQVSSVSLNRKEQDLADWTSIEIVKVIYKDVPENLHLPAERGLLQILRKLEGEGSITHNQATNKWRLRNRAIL